MIEYQIQTERKDLEMWLRAMLPSSPFSFGKIQHTHKLQAKPTQLLLL